MLRHALVAALFAALAACAAPRSDPGPFLMFFKPGSAELTPQARDLARRAARAIAAERPSAVVVLGYASREGAEDRNAELSAGRVEAVARALIEAGVSPALLRPTPLGEAGARRADVSERYVEVRLLP